VLTGALGERLQKQGAEFGATTGRRRRCGWLDAVMLREAAIVNGFTSLAVNKLDVLSGFEEIQVATRYRIGGKLTDDFPMTLRELEAAEPVYEAFPGFAEDVSDVREFDALPRAARRYVETIESITGIAVDLISVGPGRDQTIIRREPFPA
jgi:adenylosuccinate synthase